MEPLKLSESLSMVHQGRATAVKRDKKEGDYYAYSSWEELCRGNTADAQRKLTAFS